MTPPRPDVSQQWENSHWTSVPTLWPECTTLLYPVYMEMVKVMSYLTKKVPGIQILWNSWRMELALDIFPKLITKGIIFWKTGSHDWLLVRAFCQKHVFSTFMYSKRHFFTPAPHLTTFLFGHAQKSMDNSKSWDKELGDGLAIRWGDQVDM